MRLLSLAEASIQPERDLPKFGPACPLPGSNKRLWARVPPEAVLDHVGDQHSHWRAASSRSQMINAEINPVVSDPEKL